MGKHKRRALAAQRQGQVVPAHPQHTNPQVRDHLRQVTRQQVSVFSGPLPQPEDLIRYNDAFSGCAERIVAMAERQAAHRQNLETKVVDHNVRHDHRGQTLGFAISLVLRHGGAHRFDHGIQALSATDTVPRALTQTD